jgi:hypothetical protein
MAKYVAPKAPARLPRAPVVKAPPKKASTEVTEKPVVSSEDAIPEKRLPKVTVSLYGRGGVVKINDPEVTAKTRVQIKFTALPTGVSIGGIESFDGFFNVRWYATDNVNEIVSAEVTL